LQKRTEFGIYFVIAITTSDGGLLLPEVIIRPIVSTSTLPWFI